VGDRVAGRRRFSRFTGALCVVLVAWNAVVVPRLPGQPASSVVANVAGAGVLLAAARWAGLTWDELGLVRRKLPAGARWGGACAALVAAGCTIAVAGPALRPLLTDARIAGLDGADVVVQALVRVPLGTVLPEEIAFRGVLQAAASRVLPVRVATAVACAVFGVWHVRPTLSGLAANDLADGPLATVAAVLVTCLWTAAAGLLFTWLRLRSGSLLAPVLLHLAANALGLLAAAVALRLS
jgi:uncharacterized protein